MKADWRRSHGRDLSCAVDSRRDRVLATWQRHSGLEDRVGAAKIVDGDVDTSEVKPGRGEQRESRSGTTSFPDCECIEQMVNAIEAASLPRDMVGSREAA